jgi:hypothetical protein
VTELFHFTHYDNLRSIAEAGLRSERSVARDRLSSTVVGHPSIRRRRRERKVSTAPGGVVADYVPFYFAPRSPMLHNIHTGRVPGYNGGQSPIIYLVTDVEALDQRSCSYVVSDRNAAVESAAFFPSLAASDDSIDWDVMRKEGPFSGQRRERRMAEVLVHHSVPFSAVRRIGIFSEGSSLMVRSSLVMVDAPPPIEVHPEWYF